MVKKIVPIFSVLLLALALRTYRLTEIPPGLTHDEANHGREALGILDGVLLYYFPLNYGSEPLYSYSVAGSMWLLGESILALRLVNVLFGVAVIGLTYRWAAQAFNHRPALLAAALMAVSFWPLAASRQALRAGILPFFTICAVWFFWQLVSNATEQQDNGRSRTGWVIGFGLCVAATLHIYLAARVAWLIFPLFLVYLAWQRQATFRRAWLPTVWGLVLAGSLVTPMFVYLQRNPHALTRLEMLNQPLQDLQTGNIGPLLQNGVDALRAFVWPGYGDTFLAYNIPGRPVLDGVTAVFFVAGLLICLWRWKRPSYAFLLLWFGMGIIPSLLTGPTANTTRNMAALSAVYLLPAVGFVESAAWWRRRASWADRRYLPQTVAAVWLLWVGWGTIQDYFVTWGESPEVRNAYQHTLIKSLAYLEQTAVAAPTLISTVYPGPAHDPSIGMVAAPGSTIEKRWVDARYALIWPYGQPSPAIIPASTPPHPAFVPFLQPVETISLRPDDLDPAFTFYLLDAPSLAGEPLANFDGAILLLDARWLTAVSPGQTAELLTTWQVLDPQRAGPIVPPAFTSNLVMFTHLLDDAGHILAQRDSLEAPSWNWQAGDLLLQLHPVFIPPQTPPAVYQTAVGLYEPTTGMRLPVVGPQGEIIETYAPGPDLQIIAP